MPSDLRHRAPPAAKRLLDRSAAAAALLVLSPVFLFLMWLVSRDGGKPFYWQKRVARGGRDFRCWKFRSMVPNADQVLENVLRANPRAKEEWNRDFKLKDDPRITRIGQFLRKTSLDELPQLYNVLCGEMSLVGPRPITTLETSYYNDNIADYLSVDPGMTGLWQVSGRNDVTYDQRVALDTDYVRNWSFIRDLKIIMLTVKVMAFRSGAY